MRRWAEGVTEHKTQKKRKARKCISDYVNSKRPFMCNWHERRTAVQADMMYLHFSPQRKHRVETLQDVPTRRHSTFHTRHAPTTTARYPALPPGPGP
jgi:hypothetical protein